MDDRKPPPASRERHCWFCGASMGIVENRHYHRDDTCGRAECEREARAAARHERDEAHDLLDQDRGWDRNF
jgi:hypothetical protein